MANLHKSLSELFKAVADAIRAKTGTSDAIVADDFPNVIMNISTGTDTSDATAAAADILSGKTAYLANGKTTGSMPNNGGISQSLNAGNSFTIPVGFHDGNGVVKASPLSEQTSGTAASSDIISEKTAWVNGAKVTGSLQTTPQKTYSIVNDNYLEISGTQFLVHGESKDQSVIPVNGKVTISGHKNLLGNATAADVKKGVRFSSNAGFDLVGTGSGGGVPCEISVLNESRENIKVVYFDPTLERVDNVTIGAGDPKTVNTLSGSVVTVCPAGRTADRIIDDNGSPISARSVLAGQVYSYFVPPEDTSNSIYITNY